MENRNCFILSWNVLKSLLGIETNPIRYISPWCQSWNVLKSLLGIETRKNFPFPVVLWVLKSTKIPIRDWNLILNQMWCWKWELKSTKIPIRDWNWNNSVLVSCIRSRLKSTKIPIRDGNAIPDKVCDVLYQVAFKQVTFSPPPPLSPSILF